MKKIISLVLALAMIMMVGAVFAADGDLTADGSISVSGLKAGDKVSVYQFVTWDGEWVIDEDAGITLEKLTDGSLSQADLGTIASNVANLTKIAEDVEVGSSGTYTNNSVTPGSFIVLIEAADSETIYNPVIVSNDYDSENSNSVELSSSSAFAKKQTVDIDKVADNGEPDYSINSGDEVPFTVTSNIPTYNSNWIDPYFAISDELTTGLTLKAEPTVTVDGYEIAKVTDYTLTKGAAGDDGYTVTFTDSFLKRVAGSPTVTITYTAVANELIKTTAQVHEEVNKVTLTYSNNPKDSSDHGTKDKETHHYTFAIDALRMGSQDEKTGELIKVGVDESGHEITAYKEGETIPGEAYALAGAEFTLTGPNGYEQTQTSDGTGRLFFNDLDEGTYTLTETSAPTGYIKDSDSHTVVIDATFNADTTLASYTITIDGVQTASYATTTSALETLVKDPTNLSVPIVNTKGAALPSTGGIGTTIFYILGGLLVIGAAVILIARRKAQD